MSDNVIASTALWTPEESRVLARLARLIIGDDPSKVMPPVNDERILANILHKATQFEVPVRRGLDVLDQALGERDPVLTDDDELSAVLQSAPETRSLLRAMMQLVAQCFYQDPRVLTALGLEARPPFPEGHHAHDGDWSLLEPVRQRPPLFRRIDAD